MKRHCKYALVLKKIVGLWKAGLETSRQSTVATSFDPDLAATKPMSNGKFLSSRMIKTIHIIGISKVQ